MRRWLAAQDAADPVLIDGADHFFLGHEDDLRREIRAFLSPLVSGGEGSSS